MEGVDIHVDTNIGKQLSSLFQTLTALTGDDPASEEDRVAATKASTSYDVASWSVPTNRDAASICTPAQAGILPLFVFDPIVDAKKWSRLIEKEMNEQAKIVNDLKYVRIHVFKHPDGRFA